MPSPARATLGLCLAAALLVPAAAMAQQDQEAPRRRQLEVFEELLAETVQRHVSVHIDRSVQVEKASASEDGRDADGMVVRASSAPTAHGLYIADYGVIFSIQTPQVVVLPGQLAARFEAPLYAGVLRLRVAPEDDGVQRTGHASRVIEFRTHLIRQSLDELQVLLREERSGEGDPARVGAMIDDIDRLQETLVQLEVKAEAGAPEVAPEAAPAATVEVEGRLAEFESQPQVRVRDRRETTRAGNGFAFYQDVVKQQRALAEVLERNRQELAGTVNRAAIEALAQYGSVIKGLNSDDRVSVLILPPSPFGPVRIRHTDAEEYVVSVRYGDIRELDNQQIDMDEFRTRVSLHNRLGTAVIWTASERD